MRVTQWRQAVEQPVDEDVPLPPDAEPAETDDDVETGSHRTVADEKPDEAIFPRLILLGRLLEVIL